MNDHIDDFQHGAPLAPAHKASIEITGGQTLNLTPAPPVEWLRIDAVGRITSELPGPWPPNLEPIRLLIENFRREIRKLNGSP